MKSILFTLLSVTALIMTPVAQAQSWDYETSAPLEFYQFAKEGIAASPVGVSYAVGYVEPTRPGLTTAYIARRTATGGLASATYTGVWDQTYYTGVAINGNVLVVVGTGKYSFTGIHEWFIQRLDPVTLAPLWTAALPASSLTTNNEHNSYSGRVVINGLGIFASGNTEGALVGVRLQVSTGALSSAWPATATFQAGVRFVYATTVSHPMPGNTGGPFASLPQSFVDFTCNNNICFTGTAIYGGRPSAGGLMLSVVSASGVVNRAALYDNSGMDDLVKATAATGVGTPTGGFYLCGESVNPLTFSGASFVASCDLSGALMSEVIGTAGTVANDVEASLVSGLDHVYVAGHGVTTGEVWHYEGTALAASAAWASVPFGSVMTDVAIDLAVQSTSLAATPVHVTGTMLDSLLVPNAPVMRINSAGATMVTFGSLSLPTNNGCGVVLVPGARSVIRVANGLDSLSMGIVQHGYWP